MDAPNEFQPLMDEIFRDKVLRARQQDPGEKFALGIELFEMGLGWMRAGILGQHPEWNDEQVEAEVRRRLARVRQVQEHGFYQSTPPA